MKRIFFFLSRYFLAMACCGYLLTLGLFRASHRAILHEIVFRLGLRRRPVSPSLEPSPRLRKISAAMLLPDPPSIRLLEQDAVHGNVSGYELLLLAQIVASRKPQRCFEIGTFDGRTALNMAASGADRVYTLDLPAACEKEALLALAPGDVSYIRKPVSGARFADTVWASQITQILGDSASFDFTPYEGGMDLVFVDGAHSAEYVRNDSGVALRLLRPEGGVILWHDYGSPYWKDLTRALDDLQRTEPALREMRHIQGTALAICVVGPPEYAQNRTEPARV